MKLIDDLYQAFAKTPKPINLLGCRNGCCMTQYEVDDLLGQELRTANPNLIYLYLQNAIHTAGNEADFKYFVPRILDVIQSQTRDDCEDVSIDFYINIFGGRLMDGRFDSWDLVQKQTVDDLFYDIMTRQGMAKKFSLVGDTLCAICHTDIPKTRYFDLLDAFSDMTGKHIFNYSWKRVRREGQIKEGFWENAKTENNKLVFNWLMAKEESFKSPKQSRPSRKKTRGKAGRKIGLR